MAVENKVNNETIVVKNNFETDIFQTDYTEDEEDLEALRLAALSSLKKKNETNESASKKDSNLLPYNNNKGTFRGGKRRFFPGSSSRGNRNVIII